MLSSFCIAAGPISCLVYNTQPTVKQEQFTSPYLSSIFISHWHLLSAW